MSNNREMLSERDLVRPGQIVEKGIPLPFLDNRYRVDEGWWGVVTEGGAFKEVLEAGTHFMRRYNQWRDIRIQLVKKLQYTLDVKTKDELQMLRPVPAKVRIDLSVECRVNDPRKVATEIDRPLAALWDRTVESARNQLSVAEYSEVLTRHDLIGRGILQNLHAMRVPATLGIEVLHVNVVALEVLGAGADQFAQTGLENWRALEQWKIDNVMISQSRITDEWLIVNRPDIYQAKLTGNYALTKELIDKGLFDPAGFLNQPIGGTLDPRQVLGNMGIGGLLGNPPGVSGRGGFGQPPAGFLPGAGSPQAPGAGDPFARLKEEVEMLRKMPGAQATAATGAGDDGLPDGSYTVEVSAPRPSGGSMKMYFVCPRGYPQVPPELELELDDQLTAFQSTKLARWQPQLYLVELFREAQGRFN